MRIANFALIVFTLLTAFLILAASVWQVSAKTANLNFKVTPLAVDGKPMATPTVTLVPKADYLLVYPGILPDNTFYPLKMIRDRLVLTLTTDPLKKVEVMLLFADKRLGAAKALIEGGKVELGISTATKGEKYLIQAVDQVLQAEKDGKDTSTLKEKLTNASLKHAEVISDLIAKVSGNGNLEEVLKYSKQAYDSLQSSF